MAIGDWGLAQSPIPNPQSPIPNPQFLRLLFIFNLLNKNTKIKLKLKLINNPSFNSSIVRT